jgi:hypothetical protein
MAHLERYRLGRPYFDPPGARCLNRRMSELTTGDTRVARRLWQVIEPLHAVTYFAPETREATDALGLRGGWMSYFGCRAAPLGAVGANVVSAVFYNFHPSMVARAVPDVWGRATPDQLLDARCDAIDRAYRRIFGPTFDAGSFETAAELAGRAADACDVAGRPLSAANAAIERAGQPHLRLWQALTTLREHRGDGHVVSLVQAGIGPAVALVLQAATGRSPLDGVRQHRGWPDDEWDRAVRVAVERGWIEPGGTITDLGHERRDAVEADTDRLAMAPFVAIGDEATAQLFDALLPWATTVMEGDVVPRANLMGVAWPPASVEEG